MPETNLFVDIWTSFSALPLRVMIWMMVLLASINMISLYLVSNPSGIPVAVLTWGGMAHQPNRTYAISRLYQTYVRRPCHLLGAVGSDTHFCAPSGKSLTTPISPYYWW